MKLNVSHLQHTLGAVGFQLVFWAFTHNWWYGAVFAIGYFLSREVAQRQYHIAFGRSIKVLDPWEGWDLFNWSSDAVLDVLCPTVVVVAVALVMPGGAL